MASLACLSSIEPVVFGVHALQTFELFYKSLNICPILNLSNFDSPTSRKKAYSLCQSLQGLFDGMYIRQLKDWYSNEAGQKAFIVID